MLLQPNEHPTEDRLKMLIRGWCAWDKEAQVHMCISTGRRKAGRPPRYVVSRDELGTGVFHLTAESIAEAIAKAEKRIAKGDFR